LPDLPNQASAPRQLQYLWLSRIFWCEWSSQIICAIAATRVVEGVNADDVLAVLGAGTKIDIVLLEVQLAGSIDGFGLARQIREDHPDMDVILTSGVRKAADKAGDLDGPLEKPYHSQEVVRRINLLRERRRTSLKP
jgi:DNA-binding response OmpR family regulator